MENELLARAREHRSKLGMVTFVGITGSCGKTTTKDLAAGLLVPVQGSSNPGSGNCGTELIEHLLQLKPSHTFCLQELGAWGPGTLDAGLELVKPHIGVVLNIRHDHYGAFRGLEHTQAEKAKVIECLPTAGTAILNIDDPYVWGMRGRTSAKLLTFGQRDDADFRFLNPRSPWPQRLSFDLIFRGERARVQTRLIGEHLAGSAAAAIAIAHTLGMPFEQIVRRMAQLLPTPRRMSATVLGSGVAVIRDDFKAGSDSLGELLHFLQQARAERKIAVIGRIADHPGRSRPVYTSFAKSMAKVTDLLIFVGDRAEDLWGRGRRHSADFLSELQGDRAAVHLFATVRDASRFVSAELRAGDLLVLKGSGASDHLERIVLERQTEVRCWRAHCDLSIACDGCELLGSAAEPDDPLPLKGQTGCGQLRPTLFPPLT